jgi:hypothetical protein
MLVGNVEYSDGLVRLAWHTSLGSVSWPEQVIAGRDDEFLHGHLGKCLVPNLSCPYLSDHYRIYSTHIGKQIYKINYRKINLLVNNAK